MVRKEVFRRAFAESIGRKLPDIGTRVAVALAGGAVLWLLTKGASGPVQATSAVAGLAAIPTIEFAWRLIKLPYQMRAEVAEAELATLRPDLEAAKRRNAGLESTLEATQRRAAAWKEIDQMQEHLNEANRRFAEHYERVQNVYLSGPSVLSPSMRPPASFSADGPHNLTAVAAPADLEQRQVPPPHFTRPEPDITPRLAAYDPEAEQNVAFVAAVRENLNLARTWLFNYHQHLIKLRHKAG